MPFMNADQNCGGSPYFYIAVLQEKMPSATSIQVIEMLTRKQTRVQHSIMVLSHLRPNYFYHKERWSILH
jgi:hypothetical protein